MIARYLLLLKKQWLSWRMRSGTYKTKVKLRTYAKQENKDRDIWTSMRLITMCETVGNDTDLHIFSTDI
jgi:hypothetical protein